jgi:NADH:ubiquinone oxidoreductase subunit E/ActR/RegA family two-component response regulator
LIQLGILILEQEEGRRGELDKALTEDGYFVRLATDSASLLSDIALNPPHLVILDLDLPQNEGMAVLKAAHDAQPGLPILCETATPTVESAVEAMRRGAYNYISKFRPLPQVMEIVSHALERERMEVETRLKARERRIRTFDSPASLPTIDEILSGHDYSESMLISYLQDIQKDLNYLPQDALRFVARRVNVSLPRVYGIATFYKAFSLRPRGRHLIHVCLGTACHVGGGGKLLESFERELGIPAGETTYDNKFSLESVRCVGCCGLAPVFMIDGKFYGKMTQDKIPEIIARYE